MRKNSFLATKIILALAIIFSVGCKRDKIVPDVPPVNPTPPTTNVVNDAIQVTASVSGIVLNESNVPIANAVVTSGVATTTTNSNGMFIFQNISLSKENGSITVVKAGYFKGVRSFKTTAGKDHTIRLQLMQKVLSGTVNAAAGGTINSNGGATIIFPAAAFVTNAGVAYTGTVNIYSRWIDPTAANLSSVIPGDLRGIGTNGAENLLETYGMVGAELEDASGNILKIATGKKATISFPLPASLLATAPATIQLWHFDDATARWKENGTATKTGSTYSAEVDKFSFWNCDVPNGNFINLNYTLINAATNSPLVYTSTRVKRANGNYGEGITNNTGFVSGLVPKNESLVLEVISECNTVIYSQNIGPFSTDLGLGNILISIPSSLFINFSGTIINCNGTGVSNGYISFYGTGWNYAIVNTNLNGDFAFSILNCSGNAISYNYIGYDNTSSQQSNILSGIATNGSTNLGILNACGGNNDIIYIAGYENGTGILWRNGISNNLNANSQYGGTQGNSVFISGSDIYVAGKSKLNNSFGEYTAKIWKNGIPTNLTNPNPNGGVFGNALSTFVTGNDVYVVGSESYNAKIWKNGIGTNLTTVAYQYAKASAVFVEGTDVYVVGYIGFLTQLGVPKFWKNGIEITLNGATNNAYATCVYVKGTDVYIGGFERNSQGVEVAIVWKNGLLTRITDGIKNGAVNSIFVNNTDVYLAGYEQTAPQGSQNRAKYWKNGIGTFLLSDVDNSAGSSSSYAKSIFVKGNNVFVVGDAIKYSLEDNNYISKARMWKNGVATYLSDGLGVAFTSSIFVK